MPPKNMRFENGASLWLCRRQDRDVSIDLWVGYGLAHQTPHAHFLEHMAFKSNRWRGADRIAFDTEGRGITYGAWTFADRMNFHMLAPAQFALDALEILYQCFVNDYFAPEEVESEKGPIKGELLLRKSDPLYRMTRVLLREAVFGDHPLVLKDETEEGIEAITADDLKYAKRNVGPSHLSLAVVGGLKEDEIAARAAETFGALPRGGLERTLFAMPERRFREEKEEREDIAAGSVFVAFPAAGIGHPDTYALSLIGHALGEQGYTFSGRLFQEIRQKRGLAYAADTGYESYNGVGVFRLAATGIKRTDVPTVRDILLAQLERLTKEEMVPEEFERVKTSLLITAYRARYNSLVKMSDWLGQADFYGLPWGFRHVEKNVGSLTPAMLRETAARYFDGRYFIGSVLPKR